MPAALLLTPAYSAGRAERLQWRGLARRSKAGQKIGMMRVPILAMLALLIAGCGETRDYPAPPRVEAEPERALQTSLLQVPLIVPLDPLQAALEAETPRRLWTIDQQYKNCVGEKRVKLFGKQRRVTPNVKCRVVGEVTRGRLKLAGSGERLILTMPIKAVVAARDVGGVLKGETATASANVRMVVTLDVDGAWRPDATIDISYDWKEPPGIDFLGQRISFARKADAQLVDVIAGLERQLERAVERVDLKADVDRAWQAGFTVISLNRERPPAWMRIEPRALGVAGYRVDGRQLLLQLSLEAVTETFVGEAPAKIAPGPLPPPSTAEMAPGLNFAIPVLADYAELEPVILKELRKLSDKELSLPAIGKVEVEFNKVTAYATTDGKLAVGIDAEVAAGGWWDRLVGATRGTIWLTGRPYNGEDSQRIMIHDLDVYGDLDKRAADRLLALAVSPEVEDRLQRALSQDFGKDYDRVIGAARTAVADLGHGRWQVSARIDEVHHGRVRATGAGLYLPVIASGSGEIRYRPEG